MNEMLPDRGSKFSFFTKISCLTFAATSLVSLAESRAEGRVLLPFLRKVATNITIIGSVVNLFERMGFVNFKI